MYKLSIQVSFLATVISFIVSIINYLVEYSIGKTSISDAMSYNLYVKYWAYLTVFFLGLSILLLIVFLILKSKKKELYIPNTGSEYINTYSSPISGGSRPVDEYVSIRVKKSELPKYQQ